MVNINSLIKGVSKLTGSSAKMTLGKKQVLGALEANNPQVAEKLGTIFGKMKDPKFDIAYKASERGYTVGAITIRDGKTVIGNGAASVAGLGTEQAVIKMRMNIGNNGEVLRYSGFNDLAHIPTLQNAEISSSLKNGVLEYASRNGQAAGSYLRFDVPKATEAVGLKEEGAVLVKKANGFVEKMYKPMKDLLAGKEVKLPTFSKQEGVKQATKTAQSKRMNKILDRKPGKGDKSWVDATKKYITAPNGTQVPIKEFNKIKNETLQSFDAAIKHNLKIGNDKMVESLIKEKTNLIAQFDKATGTKTKDWTEWLKGNPHYKDLF